MTIHHALKPEAAGSPCFHFRYRLSTRKGIRKMPNDAAMMHSGVSALKTGAAACQPRYG